MALTRFRSSSFRRLIPLTALLVLSGCGGGSGSSAPSVPVPAAPSLTLTTQAIKQFEFTWEDTANAAEYRLLENPDGLSGYTRLATIEPNVQRSTHTVFLPGRVDASYILQACNVNGQCSDSAEVFVSGSLAEAVGYFKASDTGRNSGFGFDVALSGDGTTMAVTAFGPATGGAVYLY